MYMRVQIICREVELYNFFPSFSHYVEVAQGRESGETFLWNILWAGFGPVGNTEKKTLGADYEQLNCVALLKIPPCTSSI